MIPKKYTGEMLRGKKALCLVDIVNKGGHGVSAGSIVTIVDVVRGRGLKIKTEKCTHCGQYTYISGVSREKLELIDNYEHNDGWISVEDRLPDNAKHKGAFCPRCRVWTKYGETVGWYNPDNGGWYVLLWFMTERFLESEIDFDRGDIPKVLFFQNKDFVMAWRPFESYMKEKGDLKE